MKASLQLSQSKTKSLTALFLAMVMACALPLSLRGQQTLTVYGDNTTTNEYVPIYGYWSDSQSKCEFIIPSSKISQMAGSNISAMKFYLSSSGSNAQISATFQVFVKEVSATTLSAYTGTTGATTVFNQTITINTSASNVELNIPFSSNYSYNGGNLLVGFYQTTATGYNHTYWVGETQSTNTAWYGYGTNAGSAQTFLPKITFTYTPAAAPAASVPYTHNFENTTENGNWRYENGSYTNQWVIGSGTYSSSSRSLYITNSPSSTTPSNSYTNSSSSYVYAYRDINISSANDYEISFKWKAKGESGCWDAMYAALCPPSGTFPPSNITGSTNSLPSGYINVGDVTQSNNTTGAFLWTNNDIGWQTSTKTVTLSTTGTYRLVFYWKNDGSGGVDPPAAVDDISVTQAIPRHTLTVNASPAAGGTVSPTSGTYQEGSTVTLTATPASGYRFSSWTVSGTGSSVSSTTASTTTFTMGTANATVTANFTAIPTHTLTVSAIPSAGGTVTGSGTYYEGQTINITATANAGYRFTGWTGATVANASSANTTFTMGTANATLTANFELIPTHTLTVNRNNTAGGSVSTNGGTYYEGQTTSISATPASGYYFAGWSLTGTGSSISTTTSSPTTFTMGTTDATVTANFYLIENAGGSDSDCGTKVIYVSTSGSDNNNGSSTAPVATLAKALTLATGGTASNPAIIRMASGTYNINAPVNLISNVIIDGQWTANTTTGVWTKGTAVTTINRTNTNVEINNGGPRLVALEGNGINGFKLQDIKVTTANATQMSNITHTGEGTGHSATIPTSGTTIYPNAVTTGFKVYDNSSYSGYSSNWDGYLVLKPANGGMLSVSGTVAVEGCCDYVGVFSCDEQGNETETLTNGSHGSGTSTFQIGPFTSTNPSGCLKIRFRSDVSVTSTGANLTITEIGDASGYGVSTYAVHLNGCSSYELIRCQLMPGNASAGKAGTTGAAGTQGAGASGGSGGSGGSGSSPSNGSTGNSGSSGSYSGGSGGSGGSKSDVSGAMDQTATGGQGGTGSNGSQGATGSTGTVGSISSTANYGSYFTPSQAGQGGRGGNGSGGGGGGGGGGAKASVSLTNTSASCNGGTGGTGGNGGSGGYGGYGGYGGGSSFGLYHYGSTSLGTLTDCYIVSGTAGTGGNGGAGGAGGNGNGGSSGTQPSTVSKTGSTLFVSYTAKATGGKGGTGGAGGKGGTGGAGGKGANGVSYKVAVVTSSGLQSSQTIGYGTQPTNLISTVDYGISSKMGCTRSQIAITKTSGSWASGQYGTFINDQGSSSSSYTTSSSSIVTGFSATGTYVPVSGGPQVFISYDRSLDVISGPDAVCFGSEATYTYGGETNVGDVFQWLLFADGSTTAVDAHIVEVETGSENTAYTINAEALGLTEGEQYSIKLEIKSVCCGLSVPIWKDVTVAAGPTGVLALSGTSPICSGSSTSISLTFTGTAPFNYTLSDETTGTTSDNPATIAVSPMSTTTYTLTSLSDDTGCPPSSLTGSATVTVNIPHHLAYTETANSSYTWAVPEGNGQTYTENGDYTYSHTDANGCTQVDTLHLTISSNTPVVAHISAPAACAGSNLVLTAPSVESYGLALTDQGWEISATQNGTYAPFASPYTVTDAQNGYYLRYFASSSAGTGYSDTVQITVYVPSHQATTVAACGSYTWTSGNGETYTTSGNYTYSHTDANGCTQVDTLHLTVNNPTHVAFTETACGAYTWTAGNGQTYTESGNYTYEHTDDNGCTQVDTLHLTINNPTHMAYTETACGSYTWTSGNGQTYTESGNYTYEHTDANGCTQVDTLHLTINHPTHMAFTETACGSYTWTVGNGQTYTESGNYTYEHTDDNGCTQVDTLHLTINNPTHMAFTETACGSYTWTAGNGQTYTESGNYTYSHTDANGCTQVDTLHLTINNPTHVAYSETACGSYTWTAGNGQTYTESGNYTYSHTDDNGCTQVDTLHLTINNPMHMAFTETACGSYTWTAGNGQTYTESGNYTYSHTDANGCTQVDTLHLTINNPTHVAYSETACESYTWTSGNGETYTTSGNYTYSHTDANGCTQVDTLHLTINNPTHVAYNETACESYTWTSGNGETYTESGNYTHSHTDANGCTQVDTLHLTINHPMHVAYIETACESYTWTSGNGETYTTSGNYTYSHTDDNGCTQVDTLHLTINNPMHVAYNETACGSYTWSSGNGETYTTSGNYAYSHTDANGCTQVDTLHLTINNPTHVAFTETACGSYTWTSGNGETYTTSGNYTYSHTDANGCTQVDTLHLTINNPTHVAYSETACESYTWTSGNGETYTESGNYTHSHTDANGCTQVDTLHLTVNHPTHVAYNETACESYTWTSGNGETYTTSGNYTYSHTDANGCTQVDTLHLTINNPTHVAYNETACESYTWTSGNGETYTTSGNYTYSHTDANGCTQVDTLHLTINNPTHVAYTETACESYTWTSGNGETYTTSGNYTYSHTDANGCTQVDTLHLTVNHPTHTAYIETACESYTWTAGNGQTYTESGNYTYSHTDANGCTQVDTLHLTINHPTHVAYTETACESYTWTSGNGETYTTSGNYTYSHTDANGCTQVDTLHLTVNYVPTIADITAPAATGHNTTLALTAPAVTANGSAVNAQGWQISETQNGTYTDFNPATPVTYSQNGYWIRYTATNGCGATYSNAVQITISGASEIADIATPDPICAGAALSLTTPNVTANGSTITAQGWQISANGQTDWNNFTNGSNVTYSQNGYYIRYYATNGSGTTYSNTVQITVNDAPTIPNITAPAAICAGDELDLAEVTVESNGTEIITEGWAISSDNEEFAEMGNGETFSYEQNGYYIQYFAQNACGTSTSNTVQITVNDAPAIPDITAPGEVCSGSELALTTPNVADNGSTISTQGWQMAATVNGTFEAFDPATAVTYSQNGYYIRNTATNGCGTTTSNAVAIMVNDAPVIGDITTPAAVCAGSELALSTPNVAANGSTITAQGWQMAATVNGTFEAFDPTTTVTYSQNGYYIRYAVTSECGNTHGNTVQITVKDAPSIATMEAPAAVCDGEVLTLTAPAIAENGAAVNEQGWQISADQTTWTDFTNGSNATYSQNGYYIRYTATNSCSTTNGNAVRITVNALPVATLTAAVNGERTDMPVVTCAGNTVTLTAEDGYSYSWKKDGVAINQTGNVLTLTSIAATDAGSYAVTLTNVETQCAATSEAVSISVNALPTISLAEANGLTTICADSAFHFVATSGQEVEYAWLFNGDEIDGATDDVLRATEGGTYAVVVTDENGCSNTSNVMEVTVNALPAVTASHTNVSCEAMGSGTLTVTNGGAPLSCLWNNEPVELTAEGDNYTITITGLSLGDYPYVITNTNGCTTSGTVSVEDPGGLSISQSINGNETCERTGITVNYEIEGGTAPYTLTWVDADNELPIEETVVNTMSGSYNFTVTEGVYRLALRITDTYGCWRNSDDIIEVTVWPNQVVEREISVVGSDTYEYNGVTYTLPDTPEDETEPGEHGCETIIHYVVNRFDLEIVFTDRVTTTKSTARQNFSVTPIGLMEDPTPTVNASQGDAACFFAYVNNPQGISQFNDSKVDMRYELYRNGELIPDADFANYVSAFKISTFYDKTSTYFGQNLTSATGETPENTFAYRTTTNANITPFNYFNYKAFVNMPNKIEYTFRQPGTYTLKLVVEERVGGTAGTVNKAIYNPYYVDRRIGPLYGGKGNIPASRNLIASRSVNIVVAGPQAAPSPAPTGIEENAGTAARVEAYPNPVRDQLNLRIEGMEGATTVTITDAQGKLLQVVEENLLDNEATLTYNVKDLAQGIYFIYVRNNGHTIAKKFVVTRE